MTDEEIRDANEVFTTLVVAYRNEELCESLKPSSQGQMQEYSSTAWLEKAAK